MLATKAWKHVLSDGEVPNRLIWKAQHVGLFPLLKQLGEASLHALIATHDFENAKHCLARFRHTWDTFRDAFAYAAENGDKKALRWGEMHISVSLLEPDIVDGALRGGSAWILRRIMHRVLAAAQQGSVPHYRGLNLATSAAASGKAARFGAQSTLLFASVRPSASDS